MNDAFRESQRSSLEQLIEGEITRIIALHLTNLKVLCIPLIQAGVQSPDEIVRAFEAQISRAAERIVQEVLIPELQPDAVRKKEGISLSPDVLRMVMLNFGKLQVVFEKVFKEVFADVFQDEFLRQASATYVALFDREITVALAGGRPKDPSEERNAGAELDAVIAEFAERFGGKT